MNSIYVSFSLLSNSAYLESTDMFEKNYQTVYKTIAKFLYSHPNFSFSFSFLGNQFVYIQKKHPEFFVLLKEMVDRKQVEILGGGFYDPVMPLLYPLDRNGQIEMLSSEIRQYTGKRPRGICIYADCWDSSLVNNLNSTGLEYVLLEDFNIPTNKQKYLPIIMSELGKSTEIFIISKKHNPLNYQNAEDFLNDIIHCVDKVEKKDSYVQLQPDRIVNIRLRHDQFLELMENNWFESLDSLLTGNLPEYERIKLCTPTIYRKKESVRVPGFISTGIHSSIAKWIKQPFTEIETKQNSQFTVHDFMETYPQSKDLYNRILYVSMLVNQFKNDRIRKKCAKEKLWAAQSGAGLLCTSKGAFSNSMYRQQAYKYLMDAEKILREVDKFKESISCFDYDGDGLNEYVCRMQNYITYIDLVSGALQELEVVKNTGNYADSFSRVLEYDDFDDGYKRGLFIDHIFTDQQFAKYKENQPAGDGIFSKVIYSETKFNQSHFEIELSARAVCLPSKQTILLRKKYVISSTGMYVQYIIRNESDKIFSAKFVVESNFAHTSYNVNDLYYYYLEIANENKKMLIDTENSTSKLNEQDQLNNINAVRLTDQRNGISFCFEPNENCSYCYNPIIFKRPDYSSSEPIPVSMTYVSSLIWSLDIEPGMETEKTINFAISTVKKEKKLK